MRRNQLIARRSRWAALATSLSAFVALFVLTAGAQAVVVNDNGVVAGVSLVPSAREGNSTTASYLGAAGVSAVTSTGSCGDPAAGTEPDILPAGSWPLTAPARPICWHGGPVMHQNETFTLEWDGASPNSYWSTTQNYVQNYLGDVAAASGQLVNPYSDTTQYWDGTNVADRAAYSSVFGGGCEDNGTAKCQFGSLSGSGPGTSLPSSSDCTVSGYNIFGGVSGGGPSTIPNNLCITNSDIQNEVKRLIDNDGLVSHTQSGYTPLVTVLTPPGVVVCLESTGKLCSVNSLIVTPPPVLTASGTGGTLPAGAYQVELTYVLSGGEKSASASSEITTTGGTSTITIASPPPEPGVIGWNAYVTQPGGATFTLQNTTPNTIGQSMTLSAPPTGSGATPPLGQGAFCSYHSDVVDPGSGQTVSYVVQPWTAFSQCDEPDVPALPANPPPNVLEKNAGQRLVSPLSQSSIAAIVNPVLNGWFGLDGLETDDQNACQPFAFGLDDFSFGNSGEGTYYLQRESNNAAVVDNDPYTYDGCLPEDVLAPAFVAPTAISLGDTIDLDGSDTGSSLDISNGKYSWNFGDGTTGTGPSVEHTYSTPGNYTVTLTVTDRGGNTASLSETVAVLGASGLPGSTGGSGGRGGANGGSNGGLSVRIQLLPQGLRSVLRSGITVRVKANASADGIAEVFISRAMARRLHMHVGRGRVVIIGEGTVSQVKNGTVVLHLYLSRNVASKLKKVKHATLNVRLALVAAGGDHLAVDAAGHY